MDYNNNMIKLFECIFVSTNDIVQLPLSLLNKRNKLQLVIFFAQNNFVLYFFNESTKMACNTMIKGNASITMMDNYTVGDCVNTSINSQFIITTFEYDHFFYFFIIGSLFSTIYPKKMYSSIKERKQKRQQKAHYVIELYIIII